MNIKDIIKKTMDKLHKHLTCFYSDIIDPNIFDLDKNYMNYNLKNINNKFYNFQKDKNIQENVKEYITDIFNKKKYNTIDNYLNKPGY
jgi:hypothetical protein